jgi:hypothetical protein
MIEDTARQPFNEVEIDGKRYHYYCCGSELTSYDPFPNLKLELIGKSKTTYHDGRKWEHSEEKYFFKLAQ